jgi:hypothetical protein
MYVVFQTISVTSVYRAEVRNRLIKAEAYQVSELLVNDLGEPINWNIQAFWLLGWQYRQTITIDNTASGNALTDYQVLIVLNTTSLISQGKMNSDCSDIRFTDSDGSLINYWLESGCNSANTKIWVKVPSIPASSTKTIYVYYGNPSATSQSNGTTTFLLFDDFDGTSLDTNTWGYGTNNPTYTTYSVTGGYLYLKILSGGSNYYTNWVISKSSFSLPFIVEADLKYGGGDVYGCNSGGVSLTLSNTYSTTTPMGDASCDSIYTSSIITKVFDSDSCNCGGACDYKNCVKINASGTVTTLWNDGAYNCEQRTWKVTYKSSSNMDVEVVGVASASGLNPGAGAGPWYVVLNLNGYSPQGAEHGYFYWVRVRAYASPEPTTSIGAEENKPTAEIKRIGLSDESMNKTNLLSTSKIQSFNNFCSTNYQLVASQLGITEDYQFEVLITDLTSNTLLASCSPPTRISRGKVAEVTRIAALDSGSYVRIIVRVW